MMGLDSLKTATAGCSRRCTNGWSNRGQGRVNYIAGSPGLELLCLQQFSFGNYYQNLWIMVRHVCPTCSTALARIHLSSNQITFMAYYWTLPAVVKPTISYIEVNRRGQAMLFWDCFHSQLLLS